MLRAFRFRGSDRVSENRLGCIGRCSGRDDRADSPAYRHLYPIVNLSPGVGARRQGVLSSEDSSSGRFGDQRFEGRNVALEPAAGIE